MLKEIWELYSDESGFWFWNREPDFAVEHETQKGLSTLRNPSSKWISIKKSSFGFLALDFLMESHHEDWFLSVEIRFFFSFFYCKSAFPNFNPDLPIESIQNFRAVSLKYSTRTRNYFGLFWIEIILFFLANNFKAFRLSYSGHHRQRFSSKLVHTCPAYVQPYLAGGGYGYT